MNEKNLLLIIAIVVVAIAAAGVFLFATQNTEETQYVTIALSNSTTIEVPSNNEAMKSTDNYGIMHYVDNKNNFNVISFNSEEGVTLSGAVQMASIRDTIQLESTPVVTDEGITVYQNPNTKVYSIFTGNDTTHDNILIVSSDLDMLIHAYKSIKYSKVDESNDNGPVSKNNDNSSNRYVQDENGLYDTVTGKYVGGQFDGSTKEEVAKYNYDISHESYNDYYSQQSGSSASSPGNST